MAWNKTKKFILYWSSLYTYEKCPRQYLWSRGWGNLDVGGGPGKRKPVPEKRSQHHILMGQVIQWVIEHFYNDSMFLQPEGLRDRLEKMTEDRFFYEIEKPKWYIPYGMHEKGGVVPSQGELLEVCREGVLGFLKTMKQHKLLGQQNVAELDIKVSINKDNWIGGQMDTMIVRLDETGITIIDGKNSQSKNKYVDPDQLRWYALCFYLKYKKMPTRLGFVYYRYPYDPDMDEEGVEWIDFTLADLKGLAQRAIEVKSRMMKEEFEPVVNPSVCRLCDYESVCGERQSKKRSRSRKLTSTEVAVGDATGFVDLSL